MDFDRLGVIEMTSFGKLDLSCREQDSTVSKSSKNLEFWKLSRTRFNRSQ
jgi:hypothetical protein